MRAGRLDRRLDLLVSALCADYSRRQAAIDAREVSRRTDTEFRYLNTRIYRAVADEVGEGLAPLFIGEIGERIGYANSGVTDLSESTYKIKKQKAKWAVAEALHLVDKQ